MIASCSAQSLESGEPLAGSAGTASAFVAFSWPKPLWHHDEAACSEGVPARLAALEQEMKAGGRKLALRVFQRAPGPPTDHVELICAEPSTGRSLHLARIPLAELCERVESFLAGETSGPTLDTLQILACTDGRHDRCCAAYGRAMFDALEAEISDQGATIALAESSHLGGHRLAATCIALPSLRMYGRLRPEHASHLVDAVRHDRVHVPAYRGRLGSAELEQVVEAAALARHPGARIAKLIAAGDAEIEAILEVGGRELRLLVRCERTEFRSAASCAPDAVAETRVRWIARETKGLLAPIRD